MKALPANAGVSAGVITLVQEMRFELEDLEGVRRLYVLAHDASLEPADLQELQQAGTPVRVAYGAADRLLARVAHEVEPLPSDGVRTGAAWEKRR